MDPAYKSSKELKVVVLEEMRKVFPKAFWRRFRVVLDLSRVKITHDAFVAAASYDMQSYAGAFAFLPEPTRIKVIRHELIHTLIKGIKSRVHCGDFLRWEKQVDAVTGPEFNEEVVKASEDFREWKRSLKD